MLNEIMKCKISTSCILVSRVVVTSSARYFSSVQSQRLPTFLLELPNSIARIPPSQLHSISGKLRMPRKNNSSFIDISTMCYIEPSSVSKLHIS
jgi:hypothetical protein